MIKTFQDIYTQMADELSGQIYVDRLNYSVTQDYTYLDKMIERTVRSREEWRVFCGLLKEQALNCKLYIFGAGVWGRTLYYETRNFVTWGGVIDKQVNQGNVFDLEVMTLDQFMQRDDRDSVIVISSYKYGKEMSKMLQKAGISKNRIVNGGEIIYSLTEGAIYFDLEELKPRASGEVFVDAGGFDGATTTGFIKWCHGKGHAYCFEADFDNISLLNRNLSGSRNCEIVAKALWSKTTSLSMHMKGNCASAVVEKEAKEDICTIEAVALDDFIRDKTVTFIKMDIEGAELEAICGAKNIIQKQHPRLAVSIYHKAEDIWTIPSLLMQYYPGYRFYMRHYSFANYDTVLYAVP